MSGPTQSIQELSASDRKVFQTWVEEFDRLWDVGRLPSVARFLPSASKGPLRRAILVALIQIDLRRQWERGVRVAAESYLLLYPELGTSETLDAEIVRAEFDANAYSVTGRIYYASGAGRVLCKRVRRAPVGGSTRTLM